MLDYGADPAGIAPSDHAFWAAIASGSPVYVPAGKYTLTNPNHIWREFVVIADGQSITGAGVGQAIITYAGPCGTFVAEGRPKGIEIFTLTGSSQSISGLTIQPLTSHCIAGAITLMGNAGTADSLQIVNFGVHGIYVQGSYNRVSNSYIEGNFYGIAGGGADHFEVNNNYVSSHYSISMEVRPWPQDHGINGVISATGHGYRSAAAVAIVGTNCSTTGSITATSGSVSGVYWTQPSGCKLGDVLNILQNGADGGQITINNIYGSLYWDCILFTNSTNGRVELNTAEDCGQSGIYIGPIRFDTTLESSGDTVADNMVLHNANQGIDIDTVSGAIVAGNWAIDNWGRDLNVGSQFDSFSGQTISGNTFQHSVNYNGWWGTNVHPSPQVVQFWSDFRPGNPTISHVIYYNNFVSIDSSIANGCAFDILDSTAWVDPVIGSGNSYVGSFCSRLTATRMRQNSDAH